MSSWGLRGAVRVCLLAGMCLWARGYGASLRVLSALSCCCFTTMAALSASSSFFASPLACEARKHSVASCELCACVRLRRQRGRISGNSTDCRWGKAVAGACAGSTEGEGSQHGREDTADHAGRAATKHAPRVRASYVRVKIPQPAPARRMLQVAHVASSAGGLARSTVRARAAC